MVIREIELNDAEQFLLLRKRLDEETSFMLFEPGERKYDVHSEEKKIQEVRKNDFSEIFVLSDENHLAGFIAIMGESLKRIKHRATIVIGILQEYNGKGYGKQLFQKAESWAKDNGIRRLELTVMTQNKRALWLYSTMGFNVEGIRRKAMIIDGAYVDEFYMSKML